MIENLNQSIKKTIETKKGTFFYYSLIEYAKKGHDEINKMPYSVKILLESALRQLDGFLVTEEHIQNILNWKKDPGHEIAVLPARIVMQDFTGVPSVVDLAAMRDAVKYMGKDPKLINPKIPVDLVIDHSIQVDQYGSCRALEVNSKKDFERNRERYEFLRWASVAFKDFSVVPPATGIVHQVNLEFLAKVVQTREINGENLAFPDSLVGTDSHTPMVNGLGVVGWGVGGIEAEAAVLGHPLYMLMPDVIGFKLVGKLPEGITATDLVLKVTETLRKYGVVNKFVEFFGSGVKNLTIPDRATLGNMTPEYGATISIFPVDNITLDYLKFTGRSEEQVDLVEKYMKAQGLFKDDNTEDPEFTNIIELDLSTVKRAIAGPKKPQDYILLENAPEEFKKFQDTFKFTNDEKNERIQKLNLFGKDIILQDGSIVIAAITSCTNTSNPAVLMGAGLLAKKAVRYGLKVPPHVKTSFAPGSRVVTQYLKKANLMPYLEALGFHLVAYGCTTCIGNSGPLESEIEKIINQYKLITASVLSGNRNFEGRIHPDVRGNYLMSPLLVVAYAIAGTMHVNLEKDPLGYDPNGVAVYLKDIWPSNEEIQDYIAKYVNPEMFRSDYSDVYERNTTWNEVKISDAVMFQWDPKSTYIVNPPFFDEIKKGILPDLNIKDARCLVYLGDYITTDHISPAGTIPKDGPAAKFLLNRGQAKDKFNSFGSRRGNHNVMMRGTFGNIRIRNKLVPDVEGGYTIHFPEEEKMFIYDAAMKYMENNVPLVVIGGKDYGMGSSRDWAAKGTILLGIKAVIAESYERIHRSNLIGMGVIPLIFKSGENAETLKLTGKEIYSIEKITEPNQKLKVHVKDADKAFDFEVVVGINSTIELEYVKCGGILHYILKKMAEESK